MKHTITMGSDAIIYTPSFMKIGSGIQKLMEVGSQTHKEHEDRIILLQENS
jgi:hypothetical protein